MSWDVLFQDLPAGIRSLDEIPDDFRPRPLWSRDALLSQLRAAVPAINLDDPAWGVLDGDGFSIEFNIGDGDPVDSMMLHVRGAGAFEVVREVARVLGQPAIDCSAGGLIDFAAPEASAGFEAWRAYRDRVVSSAKDEA